MKPPLFLEIVGLPFQRLGSLLSIGCGDELSPMAGGKYIYSEEESLVYSVRRWLCLTDEVTEGKQALSKGGVIQKVEWREGLLDEIRKEEEEGRDFLVWSCRGKSFSSSPYEEEACRGGAASSFFDPSHRSSLVLSLSSFLFEACATLLSSLLPKKKFSSPPFLLSPPEKERRETPVLAGEAENNFFFFKLSFEARDRVYSVVLLSKQKGRNPLSGGSRFKDLLKEGRLKVFDLTTEREGKRGIHSSSWAEGECAGELEAVSRRALESLRLTPEEGFEEEEKKDETERIEKKERDVSGREEERLDEEEKRVESSSTSSSSKRLTSSSRTLSFRTQKKEDPFVLQLPNSGQREKANAFKGRSAEEVLREKLRRGSGKEGKEESSTLSSLLSLDAATIFSSPSSGFLFYTPGFFTEKTISSMSSSSFLLFTNRGTFSPVRRRGETLLTSSSTSFHVRGGDDVPHSCSSPLLSEIFVELFELEKEEDASIPSFLPAVSQSGRHAGEEDHEQEETKEEEEKRRGKERGNVPVNRVEDHPFQSLQEKKGGHPSSSQNAHSSASHPSVARGRATAKEMKMVGSHRFDR